MTLKTEGSLKVAASASTPADASTSVKGVARILGGTADAPTVPYGSVTGAPSIPSAYSDELAQDATAAAFAAGTHVGFALAYNDTGNAYSVTVSPAWSSVTGKPTFASVATSGSASDLQTGTLPDTVIPAGIARDSEVAAAVAALVNSAPSSLDTLGELAAALQADESAAGTLTAAVGAKAAGLVPTAIFTTDSHTPVSGEYARYNPSVAINPSLPAAVAGQRFGVVNLGSATATFTCVGADAFADASTSLTLAPGERAVLLGASGGFTFESRFVVVSVAGKVDKWTQSATKTASYTAQANEIVVIDTTGGTFTVTGPSNGAAWGWRWKAGTAANAPTIAAPSGYTISGNATLTPGLPPGSSSGEFVGYAAFGTDYQPVAGFKPQSAMVAAFGAILNTHLLAWAYAQAFRLVSATRDVNEAITTASVVWPDGSTGTFTTDAASTSFPGAIDAYHVTYEPPTGAPKTVTQTAVTRDSYGAVTAQPALSVA